MNDRKEPLPELLHWPIIHALPLAAIYMRGLVSSNAQFFGPSENYLFRIEMVET